MYMLYACCIAGERGMLLTERRRVLWSSGMSVNCTLICAVESFGQSCEKIPTVFIFVRYGNSTCPRNKVCCIFQYRTQMNTVCIFYLCTQHVAGMINDNPFSADTIDINRINHMLFECWASVTDVGPTFKQHWVNISRLLCYTMLELRGDDIRQHS